MLLGGGSPHGAMALIEMDAMHVFEIAWQSIRVPLDNRPNITVSEIAPHHGVRDLGGFNKFILVQRLPDSCAFRSILLEEAQVLEQGPRRAVDRHVRPHLTSMQASWLLQNDDVLSGRGACSRMPAILARGDLIIVGQAKLILYELQQRLAGFARLL